jgi:hypothetical protein
VVLAKVSATRARGGGRKRGKGVTMARANGGTRKEWEERRPGPFGGEIGSDRNHGPVTWAGIGRKEKNGDAKTRAA